MSGWIVTLETRNFTFEAHGWSEEEANETMGQALTRHAVQHGLPDDWWSEFEFQTHRFQPGTATRDGESL